MADNFTFLDASSVARTIRATEISSGIWVPWHATRGVLDQGDDAASEPPVLIGAVRRVTTGSLAGADGTIAQLITDGNGRLRVTLEGVTAIVSPGSSFEVQAARQHGVVSTSAGVELTVKYFFEEVAGGSTEEEIVAVVSGKRIVVLSLNESVGGAQTTITWVSNPASGSSSNIDKHAWDAYGGRVLDFSEHGHFRTVAGEALCLTTAGDVTYVAGTYVEV